MSSDRSLYDIIKMKGVAAKMEETIKEGKISVATLIIRLIKQ